MVDQLISRGAALHVAIDGAADEAEWARRGVELSSVVVGHAVVTLDVSGLTMVPAEMVRVARLVAVASAAGAEVEVACSRLSGRQLLRRFLPPEVAVVLPWAARAPRPAAPAPAPVPAAALSPTAPA
ncbi:MAG TPA: hypothetical protein VEW93_07845 [Acidimicrobiales bacterium]|nr:hypothetical protein [Acidimicrobiales bacterium]